jgi:hypothetical protein
MAQARFSSGLPAGRWWSGIVPQLTPIAAGCLATVVLLATAIRIKRGGFGTPAETFMLAVLPVCRLGSGSAAREV